MDFETYFSLVEEYTRAGNEEKLEILREQFGEAEVTYAELEEHTIGIMQTLAGYDLYLEQNTGVLFTLILEALKMDNVLSNETQKLLDGKLDELINNLEEENNGEK